MMPSSKAGAASTIIVLSSGAGGPSQAKVCFHLDCLRLMCVP
jgi:hypothetical protein